MRREYERYRTFTRRALLLGAGQLSLFGLLAGRLYYLQVTESDRYAGLADENRINLRLIPPERGLIVDRTGRPLAMNRQTYRVYVVPEQTPDLSVTLDALAKVVPLPDHDRQRVLRTASRQRPFIPITVLDDLSWDQVAAVSVNTPDLPGVQTDVAQRRVYPEGRLAAHVVGYVGAVSERDLTGDPLLGLPEFKIGKAGVERTQDSVLRGSAGRSEVEVNALGRVRRELSRQEGQTGAEVQITIDAELQRFAANRLGDDSGAAVVLDVNTGEVLAMVSSPSYDPNAFARGIDAEEWKALVSNDLAPLSDKAISGQYAPGSTFKMAVALAALEHGVVGRTQSYFCNGVLELGDGRFHCWRHSGHGMVDMHAALVESCDIYFYELARRVGVDRIADMARRLGMGTRLGIELPNEKPGLVPTRDWKRAHIGRAWQLGETLITGIGQGYVLATPLQLAIMTARLVNGGRPVTPRLTRPTAAELDRSAELSALPELGLGAEALRIIRRAMVGVTESPEGTAYAARITAPGFEMGGKTGTSQVRRIGAAERRTGIRRNEDRPRAERDHALFVGFAPIAAPRYAVAVIVEHGGGGARMAAPIARDLLLEAQQLWSARDTATRNPADAVPGSG